MSNTIEFLDWLARTPGVDTNAAMATRELDPAVKRALMERDVEALTALLGGAANVACLIAPAEEEPESSPNQGDDVPEPEHLPDDDTSETRAA